MNAASRLSIEFLLALGCGVVSAEPLKRENGQRSEELVGYTIDYLQRSLLC
ncbi:hypothetical protein GTP46_15020 [Duganella sp. FT135W]|uniref:Uncharacterized protein n=1 Tax=Duganella flavida TaxID=2692175 RepID=A0A6L8KHH4_9BURK|nr:hypothetical protein [Duganella flavida]MYM23961.1 hypothetical protein [Duganella flavida]